MLDQDHAENAHGEQGGQADGGAGLDAGLDVPAPRSPSAARLLEITARETDQWRADARAEAQSIVAAAQDEAKALVADAQREADSLVGAARLEAAQTVRDARATADDVRAETEKQRADGEAEVARLERVASDHTEHLRRHLTEMMERIDAGPAQRGDSTSS